ncbi:MAG: hydrogenase maturation protease [Candidatus Limnocylindrales bacterium]
MTRVVVFACGEPMRGDDGAGPGSVARLSETALAVAEVRTCRSLSAEDLLSLPDDVQVVVVDAVTGPPPGTVVREPLAALDGVALPWAPISGHQLPLPATVALARMLGWGGSGTFLGVGAGSFGLGEGLSDPVAAALPALIAAIEAEVSALAAG